MKRLTERNDKGGAVFAFHLEMMRDSGEMLKILKVAEKLAEYEDLEEQCIKETTWSLGILLKKWKEFFEDIAELSEYRELIKKGLLLKLPCKVGDTVYILKQGKILRNYIVQIHISQTEIQTFFSCYDDCFGIEQFGETVFLAQAEAEEALERIEREE